MEKQVRIRRIQKKRGEAILENTVDCCRIVLVENGGAVLTTQNNQYNLEKGSFIYTPDCDDFGFVQCRDFSVITIVFRKSLRKRIFSRLKCFSSYNSLFVFNPALLKEGSAKHIPCIGSHAENRILDIINEMQQNLSAGIEGADIYIELLLMQLLIIVLRDRSTFNLPVDVQKDRFDLVLDYMNKHYTEPISRNELAALTCMTGNHFSKRFKEIYKTSPTDYIMQLRVKKSCQLLSSSNSDITSIAYACGFTDSNYFSRVFKKTTHMTPREYRNTNTNKNHSKSITAFHFFYASMIINEYYPNIFNGIVTTFDRSEYHLNVVPLRKPLLVSELYDIMEKNSPSGIIFVSWPFPGNGFSGGIGKKIPVVVIGNKPPENDIYNVDLDNRAAFNDFFERIDFSNNMPLAVIQGRTDSTDNLQRLNDFLDAAIKHKIHINKKYIMEGFFREEEAYRCAMKLLQYPVPPKMFVCLNDLMAKGVYGAINKCGLRIPDDVQVTGFDNLSFAKSMSPPLTTFSVNSKEIGQTAAEMIIDVVEGREIEYIKLLKPSLIIRKSIHSEIRFSGN